MPAFNVENYIREAIESIINQTHQDWELLISDDGSSDNTKKIIDEYKDTRIRRFHNKKNLGNLATVNILLEHCRGRFIALQDADDFSEKRRLELQLSHLLQNRHVSACGTQSIKFKNNLSIISKSKFPVSSEEIRRGLPNKFLFTSASIMLRRDVYEKIGGLNEFFARNGGADWYWISKIIQQFEFTNLTDHLYYYRYNENSITNKPPTSYHKYIIGDIVTFLVAQQLLHKSDGLGDDETLKNELSDFIEKLALPYKTDSGLLLRKHGVKLARSKQYKRALHVLTKDFFSNPSLSLSWYIRKILK